MINAIQKTTTYDWLRAYTALSRSGYVTDAIRTCEMAWAETLEGNEAAIDAARRLPEYESYARALRALLHFPLTLYRVTTRERYSRWRNERYSRPVAASLSPEFTRLVREVYPRPHEPLVLITGSLSDPDALIMRGRVEGYEVVVDSGRACPVEVRLLTE